MMRRRSWRKTTKTNSTRHDAVGTVNKSIDARESQWLARKVRQVCDGGLRRRRMYLATVEGATANPKSRSSARMRGAPQVRFSVLILRIKRRISALMLGRPDL